MAITITYGTSVINIPKADTTLESIGPPEIRSLDVDTFRLALKAIEASEEGMPFSDTHSHDTERTLSGITYARFVEINSPYTVTFGAGAYGVDLQGANNNIMDVLNMNNVQVRSNNAAGLIQSGGGGGGWDDLLDDHRTPGSTGEALRKAMWGSK